MLGRSNIPVMNQSARVGRTFGTRHYMVVVFSGVVVGPRWRPLWWGSYMRSRMIMARAWLSSSLIGPYETHPRPFCGLSRFRSTSLGTQQNFVKNQSRHNLAPSLNPWNLPDASTAMDIL